MTPDGAKRWRLAYRFAGVQKALAIGVYPATGLREAREAREGAKKLLAGGQDPSLAKKLAKGAKASASANSFDAIAAELLAKKRREGKAPGTLEHWAWLVSLARAISARPIAEITAQEVLADLRVVEARGRPPKPVRSQTRTASVSVASGEPFFGHKVTGALAPIGPLL